MRLRRVLRTVVELAQVVDRATLAVVEQLRDDGAQGDGPRVRVRVRVGLRLSSCAMMARREMDLSARSRYQCSTLGTAVLLSWCDSMWRRVLAASRCGFEMSPDISSCRSSAASCTYSRETAEVPPRQGRGTAEMQPDR